MDFASLVIDIVKYMVANAIIAGVLVFILQNWLLERLKASIKFEYDAHLEELKGAIGLKNNEEIEILKDTLGRQRDEVLELLRAANLQLQGARTLVSDLYKRSHEMAHAKRLEAVQPAWDLVVDLRNERPPSFLLFDILTPKELSGDIRAHVGKKSISDLKTFNSDKLDKLRPFIGERVYALIYGYRAILGRLQLQFEFYRDKNKPVEGFDEDGARRILEMFVSPGEVEYVISSPVGRLSRLDALVDGKVLEAFAEITDGKAVVSGGMEMAKKLQEIESALRSSS